MSDTPTIVFVDCESTGLGTRSMPWSIAAVTLDATWAFSAAWTVDLTHAEPMALRIGRYYDTDRGYEPDPYTVAKLLDGVVLAGAAPHADATWLDRWLRHHGQAPTWSHRLLDVCTYAAGATGRPAPASLRDTASQLLDGFDPDDARLHGALFDAWLAREVYRRAHQPVDDAVSHPTLSWDDCVALADDGTGPW